MTNLNKSTRSTFSQDVMRLAAGTSAAQLIGVLAAPLLSRLFAPEAFGIGALFFGGTGIIIALACMRYELAIVLPESDEEAANLLALCLLSTLLIASITVPVIWLLDVKELVPTLTSGTLGSIIWLAPCTVVAGGCYTALNYWNTRTKQFSRIGLTSISNQVLTTGGNFALGFSGHLSGGSLVLAGAVGQATATSILAGLTWKNNENLFRSSIRWKKIYSGMQRYKKFPLVSTWGALISTSSWQLPLVVLASFFSPTVVGWYSLGFRIIQMPMSLIGGAVSQVFYQRGSSEKGRGNLGTVVEGLLKKLVIVSFLPNIVLTIIGADLFAFALGENWREAGVYVQLLAPWAFAYFVASPLAAIYAIYERQQDELLIHALILISRTGGIAIGGLLDNARVAIGLFSITGVATYCYLMAQIVKHSRLDVSSVLRSNVRTVAISIIYCIPLALVASIFQTPDGVVTIIGIITVLFFVYSQRNELLRQTL